MPVRDRSTAALLLFLCIYAGAPSPRAQTQPSPQVYAVLYSRGPGWTDDATAIAHPSLKAHVQYFTALADKLIAAAPFAFEAKEPRVGMVLMLSESEDAARAWAKADPAVTAQVMTTQVHRWRVASIREYKAGR